MADSLIETYDDFFLHEFQMQNGSEREIPISHIAFDGPLTPGVEQLYRERFGAEFDNLYFVPFKAIGATIEGAMLGVQTTKLTRPGRDNGHAMILSAPITSFTQRAVGNAKYVCVVPREKIYYRRKLYHNIKTGLPNQPGYSDPVDEVSIPADAANDQFVFVAKGIVAVQGGGSHSAYAVLKIPAKSGGRTVALIEPDTIIIHIWRE
jgi:hypothetical protein